eukprot:TRINITY_DN2932_c0_g1_i2.p2 TRINITY_DN2932_c0_g1~~TRINITY_DN2932_c0_g1_i2.p2  ORF type:complete len:227 (-),score=42.83 TRINITY_DN2932_c0_g1_i2:284-964(-)
MAQVIAIDGPAASGKSTVAGGISRKLGIPYINTGNMYRSVTWHFLCNGIDPFHTETQDILDSLQQLKLEYLRSQDGDFQIYLNGDAVCEADIRSPEVTACVSQVSAIPEVRQWLLNKQRHFAGMGLVVMEGRDIGTVVFPDADYKFFITATPYARALRRLNQDGETPDNSTVQSVADQIAERDRLDSTRAVAPLCQADDAQYIDTTDMSIAEVVEVIADQVKDARN